MRIDVTKTLIQGLIAAIAAVAVATQAAPGKSQGSGGWEASADHVESAVVSIKFSPVAEAEVDGDVVLVGVAGEEDLEGGQEGHE